MRDKIKEILPGFFADPIWREKFHDLYPGSQIEVLWAVNDLVKEGKYLAEAMWVAEFFANHPDPTVENESNQDVLNGKEVRPILTVRGTVAWMLGTIIGRLDPSYYSRVVTLLERLGADDAVYVRQMAAYPLAGLMANIRAKHNPDGTPFAFLDSDKERVKKLAFSMLKENRKYPRVLEILVHVFEKMRFADEQTAMHILKSFLYTETNEFQPDYVTHDLAPLLIFFAEFRLGSFKGYPEEHFDPTTSKALLRKVITSSTTALKSTIVWHMWKTIENDPSTYSKFKEYIPLFFEGKVGEDSLNQYEFLIERVLPFSPTEAVWIFKQEIEYIKRGIATLDYHSPWTLWFHTPESILEAVAAEDPDSLVEVLSVMKDIHLRNGYIGDIAKIFSAYKKAPRAKQEELKKKLPPLYEELRSKNINLPAWSEI